MGETSECIPTVFLLGMATRCHSQHPVVLKPDGHHHQFRLRNGRCPHPLVGDGSSVPTLTGKRVALFSDNSPAVRWTKRLASCKSLVAKHFVQALALRIKTNKTCPLTTLHIEGKLNSISDVPSRSFGSTPAWHGTSDESFLTLLNSLFPLVI